MRQIGQVAYIMRYLVKSMAGEVVEQTHLTTAGLDSDRLYAFESSSAPSGMFRVSSRERREMLLYQPRLLPNGRVEVLCPTGEVFPVDSPAMVAYLRGRIGEASTFSLSHAPTPQTDVRPLSLISLQTISQLSKEIRQTLDPRRFRLNLHLDLPEGPFTEENLLGSTLRIGPSAEILIRERVPRCRFITYDPEFPDSADPLFSLMKFLDRHHQGRAGVYASIVVAGPIRAGDSIMRVE